MKTFLKNTKLFIVCLLVSFQLFSQSKKEPESKPENLLDDKLDYWYKWIGVPHTSVTGLPTGTPTGDGMNGIPLGRNDFKNVFSAITLDGEKVLRATGEIYGGLTTKKEYENYHLHLKYKWGKKKWAPRLTLPRDMGIMFHLTGTNEDAFWSVFMMGLECQISEGTSGDLFFVPNKDFKVSPAAEARVNDTKNWDSKAPLKKVGANTNYQSVTRSKNFESDSTSWTAMDIYTVGSTGVFLVNGHVVMVFQNANVVRADKTVTPLTKGRIQLQSEGAEGYYKDITIQSISEIPSEIRKSAGLDLLAAKAKQSTTSETTQTASANTADSSPFKEYIGSYRMQDSSSVKITGRDNDLFIQAGSFPEMKLIFKKTDEFAISAPSMQVEFLRKEHVVTEIKITYMGQPSVGKKE
ncbi:MAG TPA: family 16 glycoside hydrolase [Cyclobacteriaceae bacterium]|nr:family 16 glycoside hydrolase [Cyclobacteriaceae bacterium]